MKNRFFGIYYKYQTKDGFTIAVIKSVSNDIDMIQVITNEKSYQIKDLSSVDVNFERIIFNVHQEDISIEGTIKCGPLLKTKKNVMSYYRFLPIECKHKIYSMYHSLSGLLIINNKTIDFSDGNGYIEGDEGRNFPTEYLWLNASKKETSITLAIATIPLGLVEITGTMCMIEHGDKEYRFGTYNSAKPKLISRNHIIIKKGKYVLDINIDDFDGHALKAPVKGEMIRTIHECPSVGIRFTLKHKEKVLIDDNHPYASFEYVFNK